MSDLNLYECPEGCNNKDKDDHCMKCVEGDNFVPLLKVNVLLRKVGAKNNPSYVIPVDKILLKDRNINVKKKVHVVISQ